MKIKTAKTLHGAPITDKIVTNNETKILRDGRDGVSDINMVAGILSYRLGDRELYLCSSNLAWWESVPSPMEPAQNEPEAKDSPPAKPRKPGPARGSKTTRTRRGSKKREKPTED